MARKATWQSNVDARACLRGVDVTWTRIYIYYIYYFIMYIGLPIIGRQIIDRKITAYIIYPIDSHYFLRVGLKSHCFL